MQSLLDKAVVNKTTTNRPASLRRVLFLVALALLAPLFAILVIWLDAPKSEQETLVQLEAVNALKAEEIEIWLAERKGDGESLTSSGFVKRVATWRSTGNSQERAAIMDRLQITMKAYGYGSIQLLDPQGKTLLALGDYERVPAATIMRLPEVFARPEVMANELFRDEQGNLHLDVIVPLLHPVNGRQEPLAALVLHMDPQRFLFPLVQRWLNTSASVETLLVRRDGESILYLNDLRHKKDAALSKRLPLAQSSLPAAVAIQTAKPGKMEGKDYRGVPVLAAFQPVAGTDWRIVTKIDRAEIMKPVYELALWVGLATLLTTGVLGVLFWWNWRQQKKNQQMAMQLQKNRLMRQFYDQPFFGMALISATTNRWLQFNDTLCTLLGYSRQELTEKSWAELTHPDDIESDLAAIARLQRGEAETYTKDKRYLRKDGVVIFVSINVGCQRHPDGSIDFLVSTIQDITERRKAEVETKKLLQAIEQSPVSVVVTNLAGTIEYVNPRFTQVTGFSREEAIGQNPKVLNSGQTPSETFEELWQTLTKGEIWHGFFHNRRKNGQLFWEEASISPIKNSQGETTHYVAVKEDISERRKFEAALEESEINYRTLADSGQALIWRSGTDKLCNYFNRVWLEFTGRSLEQELGKGWTEGVHPDDLARCLNTYTSAFDRREKYSMEYRLRHHDGEYRWIQDDACPDYDSKGEFIGYIGYCLDIDERYQTHMELAKRSAELTVALEAARVADKVKDELLANVSHELRTPLNVVIGLAYLARSNAQDEKQRKMLDTIAAAGNSLAGIINDLLDLSKIAAGQLQFESTTFSLREQILRSNSVMAHKAAEKGLELVEVVDDEVPDVLHGDPLRLEQILMNLLSNAIKFTEEGKIEVHVSLFAREEARVGLLLEVKDTGIGLSPEAIERLFKPFYQADASITRKFGGTGLGLSICKRLAEMMGGSIEATCREGGGAVFSVRLWLELGAPADVPVSEKTVPVFYQNTQVLVVEDQPFNQLVVNGLLKHMGITSLTANNGQEALDLLDEMGSDAFDLILMDIQMPVLDGISATQAIRTRNGFANLPIIAMTAHTMTHERKRFAEAGMNDHIGKPVDKANFNRLLARWIDRSKQCETCPQAAPAATCQFPAIAGIDTENGLAILMGNEENYRYWLKDFVDQAPGFAIQIRQALAAGTPEQASFLAHSLKGRVGMLGMQDLHVMAAALEEAVDRGESIDALLDSIEQTIAGIRNEIVRVLGE